jgi:hypothetical protein
MVRTWDILTTASRQILRESCDFHEKVHITKASQTHMPNRPDHVTIDDDLNGVVVGYYY